jgi:hypothetical protein
MSRSGLVINGQQVPPQLPASLGGQTTQTIQVPRQANQQRQQQPVDGGSAIIQQLQTKFQVGRAGSKVEDADKITNLADLVQAIGAGQIEWIEINNSNDDPTRNNNIVFHKIKYKTTSDYGSKENTFNLGDVFPPEAKSYLALICSDVHVKFTVAQNNPALSGAYQLFQQMLPSIAIYLIGTLGYFGGRAYKLHEFKNKIAGSTIDAKEALEGYTELPKDRQTLESTIVGMPSQYYDMYQVFNDMVESVKNDPSKLNGKVTELSGVLTGTPGCAKSHLTKNMLHTLLNEFDGKDGRPLAGVIDIGPLLKERNWLDNALMMGTLENQAIEILKVADKKGFNILTLYADDPKIGDNSALNHIMGIGKKIHDILAQSEIIDGKRVIRRGGKNITLENVQNFSLIAASNDEDFDHTNANVVAVLRRIKTVPIKSSDFKEEQRALLSQYALAKAFDVSKDSIPQPLIQFLVESTVRDYKVYSQNLLGGSSGVPPKQTSHTLPPSEYIAIAEVIKRAFAAKISAGTSKEDILWQIAVACYDGDQTSVKRSMTDPNVYQTQIDNAVSAFNNTPASDRLRNIKGTILSEIESKIGNKE